jgi:hypothetical protein
VGGWLVLFAEFLEPVFAHIPSELFHTDEFGSGLPVFCRKKTELCVSPRNLVDGFFHSLYEALGMVASRVFNIYGAELFQVGSTHASVSIIHVFEIVNNLLQIGSDCGRSHVAVFVVVIVVHEHYLGVSDFVNNVDEFVEVVASGLDKSHGVFLCPLGLFVVYDVKITLFCTVVNTFVYLFM